MSTWRLLSIPLSIALALLSVKVFLVLAGTHESTTRVQNLPEATLEIQVNYADDWVAGVTDPTDPGETVVITVTDHIGALKADAVVTAETSGDFFVGCDDWFSGECPDIQPGDRVFVWAAGLVNEVNPVGAITGTADEASNTIDGILSAGHYTGMLNLGCEVWEDPGPSPIYLLVDPEGGSFSCDFDDVGWDLERGDVVAVRYWEPDGDQVINILEWPWMRVNYAHDWVGANYEVGHSFWITVTDSQGGVKATSSAQSVLNGGWDGPGFKADTWIPDTPDIVPGDFVHFTADNGYTNTLQVGSIAGVIDIAADTVSGPIFASGFGTSLTVECHPWGAWDAGMGWVPIKQSWAEPDGSQPFTCDWGSGGEWDMQPGQDVAVMYIEPDFDRVIDVYREPAPYLGVNLQAAGQATPGGNYQFRIEYWNQGDAPAENVVITSTLSNGMSYLMDTSMLPYTGAGSGEIVWNQGSLGAGMRVGFDLFVEITASQPELITNTIQIATSTLFDQGEPWEKNAVWVLSVAGNDTHLVVDKRAWTDDPAAGEEVIFEINLCNQGSTASSQVTLTDTLPTGMNMADWWAHSPGWEQASSTPDELVLTIPTISGSTCTASYLRADLGGSLAAGDHLTNTVRIEAENDLETADNQAFWTGQVGEPHTNLGVDKWWNGGQLTPGGMLRYGIGYQNSGNVPVAGFRITDTLPADTTFLSAWYLDFYGSTPFPPSVVTDEYVVWEIPELVNGIQGQLEVRLAVDHTASPGSLVVNSVEISPLPGEDTYDDNQAAWTEVLAPSGPNLRVRKWHNWNGDSQLNYDLHFENRGDHSLSNVWITDTLPAGTHWEGSYEMEFEGGELTTFDYINGTRTLIWLLDELPPGETGWLNFAADLDEPGAPARWYTNTVEISTPPGDTSPGDNIYQDVAFSGGEVQKVGFWLATHGSSSMWGLAAPGSTVTVTTPRAQVVAWADPGCDGCWNIEDAGALYPGEVVEVVAGQGILPVAVTIPDPFDAGVDTAANDVFGQIGGWFEQSVAIHGQWSDGYRVVTSDGDGEFLGHFDDIPPGSGGYVQIVDQANYAEITYQRPFRALDLLLDVNYGHDWVEGPYQPGHTVWITATESDGSTVKSWAELWSTSIPGWDGGTGFSTLWQGWGAGRPDLQAGDWVFGQVDNGYEAAVRLGQVSIQVNTAGDLVSGAVQAGWLSDPLPLRCEIWEAPGAPVIETEIDPDGGSYSCDFGSEGWDIQPYQMVAVMYLDPAGHRVINMAQWPHLAASTGPLSDGDRRVSGEGFTPQTMVEVIVTDDLGNYVGGTQVETDSSGSFDTGDALPRDSLAPWNLVQVDFGNGMTETLTVYPLSGQADPETDRVTVTAAGLPTFRVSLEYCLGEVCGWVDLGEIGSSGQVAVDLMAERGFDVRPEASFHAHLYTSNGHEVIYSWLSKPAETEIYLPMVFRH